MARRAIKPHKEIPGVSRFLRRVGGKRAIMAPTPGLKLLQSKINDVLQQAYRPPAPAAFGFVRKRNIKMNAAQHVGNRWVLNVGLTGFFFPSINFGRVRGLFIKQNRTKPLAVCCYDISSSMLSTAINFRKGPPTSPVLSKHDLPNNGS